eukprot:gene10952-22874_t
MGAGVSIVSGEYENTFGINEKLMINILRSSVDNIDFIKSSLSVDIIEIIQHEEKWTMNDFSKLFEDDIQFLILLRVFSNSLLQSQSNRANLDMDDVFKVEISIAEGGNVDNDDFQCAIDELQSELDERCASFDYMIIAENITIENISFLQKLDKTFPITSQSKVLPKLQALNISGNLLTDSSIISESYLLSSHPLQYLQIGGNKFQSLRSLTQNLPNSLLILDLSYTESLNIEPGSFLHCSQLQKLILDGCKLDKTFHSFFPNNQNQENDDNSAIISRSILRYSIFSGLVALKELSIKENLFINKESLLGILFFAMTSTTTSTSTLTNKNNIQDILPSTLLKIYLEDNPVCESQLSLREVSIMLSSAISSLEFIDNQRIERNPSEASRTFDVLAMRGTQRVEKEIGVGLYTTNEKGLDSMEVEFLAALRGEKDNTVVS